MVAWWPGHIEPAQVSDHVSAFWDVLPTFTDLAGVPSPSGLDGISFLPTLLGNEQKKHEYLYWEFHELGGRIALRMGNWKAVRYNVNTKNPQPTELYDLSNDIGETKNLAAENPEIVKEMEDLMKSARIPSSVFTFASETIIQ
jgi:arylsulfatase A